MLASFAVLRPDPAAAIDVNSADYLAVAPGTNLLMSYTQFATSSQFYDTSGTKTELDSSLDSFVEIFRYVRYVDVAGFTGAVQAIVPMGALYDARLDGADLNNTRGFGDPILAALLFPINNKATETYVGVEGFVYLPLGQYDSSEVLNLGENRWKVDLEVGWYQGLGHGVSFQLTGDVIWYGDNSEATGGQTLTQDNTYQFQGWLSYAFAPSWSASVGYAKLWGGNQYLAGMDAGLATKRDQLRFELGTFVTPTFQVLGTVQTDLAATGGYEDDFRGTLRLMKVY